MQTPTVKSKDENIHSPILSPFWASAPGGHRPQGGIGPKGAEALSSHHIFIHSARPPRCCPTGGQVGRRNERSYAPSQPSYDLFY
jgi:hypothetical protein